MKVIKKVLKTYKNPIPVYDLQMQPENPCFSLGAGIISHNTIPPGAELRRIFVPRSKNHLMNHFDYSQMELRVLAFFANEKTMMDAFLNGADIHRFIASHVYGKPEAEITKNERSFSKFASFSMVYGKSLENFAADYLKGDLEKTKALFALLYDKFPGIKEYIDKQHKIAITDGVVYPMFGDPLHVLDLTKQNNPKVLAEAERFGVNYPIQNTASQVAALCIYFLAIELSKACLKHVPLGFTHDAGDFEFEGAKLFEYTDILKRVAVDEARQKYGIPVDVDWEIGVNMFDQMALSETSRDEKSRHYKFKATEQTLEAISNVLKTLYTVDLEITDTDEEFTSYRELFTPKTAYSLGIGSTRKYLKGKISLTERE